MGNEPLAALSGGTAYLQTAQIFNLFFLVGSLPLLILFLFPGNTQSKFPPRHVSPSDLLEKQLPLPLLHSCLFRVGDRLLTPQRGVRQTC